MTMMFCVFLLAGIAGIVYTAHSLAKLDDFFDEVYIYDRNQNT